MQDDIKKLVEIFNDNFFDKVSYITRMDEDFDLKQYFALHINDRLYNDYFSFLDKYRHNTEFYEALLNAYDDINSFKLILPDDYYYDILDYAFKKDKDSLLSSLSFFDEDELNYCLSLGYSLNDIIEKAMDISDDILFTIYLKDRSLCSKILDKYGDDAYSVIAYEFINGDKDVLKNFFKNAKYTSSLSFLFKKIVDNCNSFDINTLIDDLLLYYDFRFTNLSFITDNDLLKNMIVKGGAKALILAKNPTSELVSLAKDFSYNDYVFIAGDYKKSEDLLLNLLNRGYLDALFNAPVEIIGEKVYDYLVKNNVDIELLKDNYDLQHSYAINKYLVLHGYYDGIKNTSDIFTNINAFNFVLEMLKEGKCPISDNSSILVLNCIINKEFEKIAAHSNFLNFSKEVGDALIQLGLTSEAYLKYFRYDSVLSLCFAQHGDYEVLFKGSDLSSATSRYLDKLTYDMYLKYVDEYGIGEIPTEVFTKFVKEGHYDIFLKAKLDDTFLSDKLLDEFGFNDLTYEEYLKLPDYVRDFPLLKNKYLAYSADMYLDVLKSKPTAEALEQAALNDMPYEEFISYLSDRNLLLTFPTVMHYLEENHLEIIKYVNSRCDFPQIDLMVDKILSLVHGNVPPDYVMECSQIANGIVEKFIKNKDFSILNHFIFFNSKTLELLIDNGYTLDDFIKDPFFNCKLICHLLTKDNEEKIMECFEKIAKDKNIPYMIDAHTIIVKAYREKYNIANINKLTKLFRFNAFELYKSIDENDYDIFNELEFNDLFYNKLLVDKILPYLSLDKIKSNLNNCFSNNMRGYIIEKMVNLGHSEFIDYFTGKISDDVVKKALLAGYFPSEEVLINNSNLKRVIKNLSFTEEELNYLKSRMDKQPLFVIYFKDILQNLDLIYSYIVKEPRILLYCDDEIACNHDLLRKVVVTNPFIVCQLISKFDHSFILELVKLNNSLLDYISTSIFNNEELVSLVQICPDFIDRVTNDNEEIFNKAFEAGYKISDKSSFHTLIHAVKFNILIPKDVLLKLNYSSLFSLLTSDEKFYNNNKDYIKEVLDTLKSRDEDEFLWQLYSYVSSSISYNNVSKQLNDEYHAKALELKDACIDGKERYLFNLLLLNIANLDDEHYKIKIDELLEKSSFKIDIISSVYKNGKTDLANLYAKKYFKENPLTLIQYVTDIDDEFVKVLKEIILDYPNLLDCSLVIEKVSKIVESKALALKLFELGKYEIFFDLSEELRNNHDILVQYIKFKPDYILVMNKNEYYRELCIEAFTINPELYLLINDNEILCDEDILKMVLPLCASAFLKADSSLQTIENFRLIKNYNSFRLDLIDVSLFTKIVSFNLFDVNDEALGKNVIRYLFNNKNDLDPAIFKNDYIIQIFIREITNDFKTVISLFDYFDVNDLPSDICEVGKNTQEIIKGADKVNLLENTSLLSYNLVKYIYPLMGLSATLDLLKYNSKATDEICEMIKGGRSSEVLSYWQFVKNFNLFPNNERLIHFAFMNYSSFDVLINDVLLHQNELTENDIENLRKIIVNKNCYNIMNFAELKNYEATVEEHIKDILSRNDINQLKNGLAVLFGFENIENMERIFNNFQFDNFAKLKYVYDDIKKKYDQEYLESVKLQTKDIKLIILMKKIIETNNVSEIKELFANLVSRNQKILDYSDNIEELITKFRKIYNAQFSSHLTDVASLQKQRISYDDPNNKYGVTIIKMDGEPFNFLAHRLYNYDKTMKIGKKNFSEMLMEDPSLWTKLDGASTLSTSSFSDKGFWYLHSEDSSGVVYLFNDLPPDFLLFMYGRDLNVQHGGHNLRPTATYNLFTDIESLNQSSCYRYCSYNEVAGFRKDMLPCAFACISNIPNPETIKAAKYFSEFLGVDIPILMFDIPAYEKKKNEDVTKAIERYKNDTSYEALLGIFYDGIENTNEKSKILADKIELCLGSLKERYYKGEISLYDLLRKVQELESVSNRIFAGDSDCLKEMRKLQIFKKALCILKNISNEEIVRLEAANLGESGIMYKFDSEGQTYLLKPAVDKVNYQKQNFRTDVQVAASKLQKLISPETSVEVQKVEGKSLALSKQEYLDIDREETKKLNDWAINGGPINQKYLDQLLREYVLDFVICNFDAFSGNFVVDINGNIRGIDKEQAFRFIDNEESLKPDFSYVPNGNSRIPIYKILFERYKNNEINLNLEIISDTLEELKGISDEEYLQIFRDYATSLGKENAHVLLEKILNRKHVATEKIEAFLQELGFKDEMDGVVL